MPDSPLRENPLQRLVRQVIVDPDAEQPLHGGNVSTGIVRIGDTVRRPAGPQTPAVHALLAHLHGAGFHHAPQPLGIDEQGREVLSYVAGEAVHPGRLDLLDDDRSLIEIGRLIRDFHDAAAEFTPPADAQWWVAIPDVGADLIVHHDLAPWNLIAADGSWTLIDWDTAAPGTRLWDLAYAAHGFVPLTADPAAARGHPARRLRVLVDAYGLDEAQRLRLVELLPERTGSMHTMLAEQSAAGVEPWTTLWCEGHGRVWWDDTVYIAERTEIWTAALLG
ncbi:phosphotransferase [Pseudonocardia sp. GCM10023141]|uniref:phosphotransferase n=1 Tax=Pseudonocardia sp. GCM10023141 TaxID=3252653 RepID=UPI003614F53F